MPLVRIRRWIMEKTKTKQTKKQHTESVSLHNVEIGHYEYDTKE